MTKLQKEAKNVRMKNINPALQKLFLSFKKTNCRKIPYES